MKDEGNSISPHEYNASISMNNISQLDFNTVKNLALNYANNLLYGITAFNCSDYALDCFNSIRPAPLDIPNTITYIPFTNIPLVDYGTTPNGIYKKLTEMKTGNHPEAANIQTGVVNSAPIGHGPCN
jgi:hypothetical protein